MFINFSKKNCEERKLEPKGDNYLSDEKEFSNIKESKKKISRRFCLLPYSKRHQYKDEYLEDESLIIPRHGRIKKSMRFENKEDEEENKKEINMRKLSNNLDNFVSTIPRFQMKKIEINFDEINEIKTCLINKKNEIMAMDLNINYLQVNEICQNRCWSNEFKLKEIVRRLKYAISNNEEYSFFCDLKGSYKFSGNKNQCEFDSNENLEKLISLIHDLFIKNSGKLTNSINEEQTFEIHHLLIIIAGNLNLSRIGSLKS